MKRILTGERPTGKLHIGHLIGTLDNRVKLQDEYDTFIIIADFQYMTDRKEYDKIEDNILEIVKDYLAVGLDPNKVTIFVQSKVIALSELYQMFSSLVSIARVKRNPTVKDELRSAGIEESNMSVAMFAGFKANLVPVGEDQLPHLEQTREIARSFNKEFKEIFPIPKALLSIAPRVLGLDGNAKMSKSLGNTIMLSDSPDEIRKKLKKAVTDSGKEIKFDAAGKPAISNLMTIYSFMNGDNYQKIEKEFKDASYSDFKDALAEEIIKKLTVMQERRASVTEAEVKNILVRGTEKANEITLKTLQEAKEAMHIYYPKIFK
ncbi:MAG: Tryptophan-tRNA ligase [candidate division CPR2 bacterium GW2011_GWC2_39_10]|uniref:Tryptophan--tRNA ligase n=1 Tax=candidate division CPR2 bacterium GW2011_GWC2_39_10 TaxID=1618345 RepID=A0A0G0P6B6_UNCC2|nr:MAG: Tryptophan-tRNA ligase [candidate division CPR2 bacterium GW2011_GWC2_39_10]